MTGRGAHQHVLTNTEQSRLIEFVTFLTTSDMDWMAEVERRLVNKIDDRLINQLKRRRRESYLSVTADALENPASALCRALEKGPLGPMEHYSKPQVIEKKNMSPIERLLLEWIIANLLLPGADQFVQAATLLRVLDIFIAAQSGRELGVRVCTTKILEQQRRVAIELVIKTALDQAGL